MAVMGDAPPEVWGEELRRVGRVEFPVRRKRLVIQRACFAALFAVNPALSVTEWIHADGPRLALGLISVALVLAVIGVSAWQFITQHPTVIVDNDGIHTGRAFRPWTEIGTIGIPHGPKFAMVLPIIPTDAWAKHLGVSQDNVKDIPALAEWLTEELRTQRRSATP
jgi:hypothetical protein